MKRRDFVKQSMLASGATWLACHSGARAAEQPSELNIGLIGAGAQGRILLSAAVAIPGVRVAAVCDIWPYAQKYAERYLARYQAKPALYADYPRMLDRQKSLDAVLIATPDFVHAAQTKACLESGRHVYCEPMLARGADEMRSVLQVAKQTGKLLQTGYQRRSDALYRHVLDKLLEDAQLVAQIDNIQTQWATPPVRPRGWPPRYEIAASELARHGYRNMNEFRNWLWFPKYSAGPFCNFVAPQLDVCTWFLGAAPRRVLASGDGAYYDELPNLDTVMAVYEVPVAGGATVRISSCLFTNTSAGGQRRFERFLGVDGSIQVSDNARWVSICREANSPSWEKWLGKKYLVKKGKDMPLGGATATLRVSGEVEHYELPPIDRKPKCQSHLENFFAAVRGDEPLRCSGDDALPSHLAAWRTLEAVKTGKKLEIG